MLQEKSRFIVIVFLLLLLGFSLTSITGYFVAKNALQNNIQANLLPLSSDNVYSEIQRDILPTVVISSLMAQDTFVREWIIQGESHPEKISQYLLSIQQRYNTETAFFISNRTLNYYHSSGLLKKVSLQNPSDAWYFRVEKLTDDFEINVDIDSAKPKQTTFFVNYKIKDYQGQYLGAIGVGLSTEVIKQMIENYQSRYNRQVYFVEANGDIALHGKLYHGTDNIKNTDGLSEIVEQALNSDSGNYIYNKGDSKIFVNTRFIKELDWYLFVEQIEQADSQIKTAFLLNIIYSALISIAILAVAYLTVGRYQKRLEIMATKDSLTGINNRHIFEIVSKQTIKMAIRKNEDLSALILDIDHFKKINDSFGHLIGDKVLVNVANILIKHVRDSDLVCRWGGEEFIVLLPNSNSEKTFALAEKIRNAIMSESIQHNGQSINITVSIGVSDYEESESENSFLKRVDKALYKAKNNGRNRVEVI